MYSRLTIHRLRGLEQTTFDDLRRINLLVGRNNTGKTSVLEGILLLGGSTNPLLSIEPGRLRGQRANGPSLDTLWRPLFGNLDPRTPIEIAGRWEGEKADRSLTIEALNVESFSTASLTEEATGVAASTQEFPVGGLRFRYRDAKNREITTTATYDSKTERVEAPGRERNDFVRTAFLSARAYSSLARDAQQFSHLKKIKQEDDILEALRLVDPRVQRIEVLSESAQPSVYVDLGMDSLLPLAVCGEGLVRLFSIIVSLTGVRKGVLLIDEIDNGLHYSVLDVLWKTLSDLASKHDVQIVATTHNDEMISSALRALGDKNDRPGLFRLDLRNERPEVVSYNDKAIEGILESGFEVRG